MSYTDNESLIALDWVIRDALEDAARYNKSKDAMFIASAFRRCIDHPKLSEAMYKIDLAMQGYDDGASRAVYEMAHSIYDPNTMTEEELIQKYIQQTPNGYQVYDQEAGMWLSFSEQAEITITIQRSAEHHNQPELQLHAYDPKNGATIFFIDPHITRQDLWDAELAKWSPNQGEWREIHYEDPLLSHIKSGSGMVGKSAGTLNAVAMGYHYQPHLLNPTGIQGSQWRSLDGVWHSYKEIEQAKNGFVKQSLKTSHQWAKVRGQKAMPVPKTVGTICFLVNVGVSGYKMADAHLKDDANKWGVTAKGALDITMGFVAFIPGLGWAISGTYFLMDVNDVFGDWGKASGYSSSQASAWARERDQWAKEDFFELDFEIDYHAPAEQISTEMLREIRTFERDKTYAQPKTIYQSKAFRK